MPDWYAVDSKTNISLSRTLLDVDAFVCCFLWFAMIASECVSVMAPNCEHNPLLAKAIFERCDVLNCSETWQGRRHKNSIWHIQRLFGS